jgi:outer membrane protein OmpA-like peptidoglycan-associated protein
MHRLGLAFLLFMAATGTLRAADAPTQRFVVFFQEWSAALDEAAQAVISQAADWVKTHPGYVAHVNGFASTVGSRQANILLADLRAQIVVDQMVSDGLAATRIRQRGRGPVPFALTAQESRRVEISVNRR